MNTFMVGEWPVDSRGGLEGVKASSIKKVPKMLAKRSHHKGRKIVPNTVDGHTGLMIGEIQYRIFDIDNNQDDFMDLCEIMARIGLGNQAKLN